MPSDKEDVLNIRKNLYGGLDYMPDCYDKLVSIPNGKAFVAIHEDKVVSINDIIAAIMFSSNIQLVSHAKISIYDQYIYLMPVITQLLQYNRTLNLMLFYNSYQIKACNYGRDIKGIYHYGADKAFQMSWVEFFDKGIQPELRPQKAKSGYQAE